MTATILGIVTYPSHKSKEVGQAFLKYSAELPAWVKRVGKSPYLESTTRHGIRAYTLYEVEDAKLAELIRALANYYTKISSDVEGYTWQLRPVLAAEEALPLVGLAPPKPKK